MMLSDRCRRMAMFVWVRMTVRVLVCASVVVGVARALTMTVFVRMTVVRIAVVRPIFVYDELRRRHARTQHTRGRYRSAIDRETSQRDAQLFERQAGVEQGAEHHVPGRAVETVEIENA